MNACIKPYHTIFIYIKYTYSAHSIHIYIHKNRTRERRETRERRKRIERASGNVVMKINYKNEKKNNNTNS